MSTPFIVAEISANHRGSIAQALQLITQARNAGADAVKFQTWAPDQMAISDYVMRSGPWAGQRLRDLYRDAWTPWEWYPRLFAHAAEVGIEAFTTVFDKRSLDLMETNGYCKRYKIASFELVDLPLIRMVAETNKPMVISTGMGSEREIAEAVATVYSTRNPHALTLLKCTSAYPATAEHANLATMSHMAHRWRCDTGLSDHTEGIGVATLAAGTGAKMIEKHMKLPASLALDSAFSVDPRTFAQMVTACREAAQAWGEVSYGPDESEKPMLALRRSVHYAKDLAVDEKLDPEALIVCRPADGLHPREFYRIIGRRLNRAVKAGDPVRLGEMV